VDNGKALIYEGHDIGRSRGGPDPKNVDQPLRTPAGALTQNGVFLEAAQKAKAGTASPELVRVYEKIRAGIWVYAGIFRLVDAWQELSVGGQVFKLRLELTENALEEVPAPWEVGNNRIIPTAVKLEVWKRDGGKCVKCSATDNLHFDHDIPYSKGGSSLTAANIQLLCARHNLAKHNSLQ